MTAQWKETNLGQVCDFIRGPFGGSLKKSSFQAEGFAVYEQQHAINDQFSEVRYFINEDKFDEMRRFELNTGDLIMSCSGTMGKTAIVPGSISRGIINQALLKLTPHEQLDVHFLQHWMKSPNFQEQLLKHSKGVAIKNVASVKVLKGISVKLPPLPEQKRIVAILDEAFAGIDQAIANTEKNLANARELFESSLRSVFDQERPDIDWGSKGLAAEGIGENTPTQASKAKGRAATDRIIVGDLSLSVGLPPITPRAGWIWSNLSEIARLESGHTPSRKHPEYWDGDIPWLGIKDARKNHGKTIDDTDQHTNQLGLANSAARLLPKDTVCLSRTASVGYVVIMGTEMATSQDFVNWTCSSTLLPKFLQYLFLAEGGDFKKYSSGAVHQTIYFPEVKAFHICHPEPHIQSAIVDYLDGLREISRKLEEVYRLKVSDLEQLKQSLLQKAFIGELTAKAADREVSAA